MATQQTRGAFLFGLRVMAIDGTTEDLPDTPENSRVFGRPGGNRGDGAFPQAKGVYLVECGTHAIVDAGFWHCRTGEDSCARRLLRSVATDMLLTWDSGLHSFDLAQAVRARSAHFLGRVPGQVKFKPLWRLSDGSYLAYIYPSEYRRRKRGEHLLVRVIEYTLTDPALPGHGKNHRLMTSLLDPDRLSFTKALSLVCDAIPEFQMVALEQHEAPYRRLLTDIARYRLPERDNRTNPRVVKRKMSNFRLKRAEHQHWPQPSVPFREAVAISNRASAGVVALKVQPSIAYREAVPVLK